MKPTNIRLRAVVLSLCSIAFLLGVTGCASVKVGGSLAPGASSQFTDSSSFYVVKLDADERDINQKISADLQKRGYQSSSGPRAAMPDDVDVVVSYEDRWMWDMSMYLLRLNITVKSAATSEFLGSGESYRTSLARKSPEVMISEIFDEIFGKVSDS